MTKYRILYLAYNQAIDLWDLARAKAERFPECEMFRELERSAWEEQEELRRLFYEEERRNH